ncbi:Stress response protein YvgO [Folsomia candida]|uniref:Stress response protein YvgO n=2 Tax=Folsomia candida TaxID=158441 RepID=A0A226DH50_FOLCA|nr:Stress response protein YvgO [Folsomia candida]
MTPIMTGTVKLSILLVGVVLLLALPGGHLADEDKPLTPKELEAIDKEMEAAIAKTDNTKEKFAKEDAKYLSLNVTERSKKTEAARGVASTQSVIGDIVKGAETVVGIGEKIGNTGTSVLGGLVNAAQLGFEIGKELNRLKESKTGFLKGIMYEVQFQTEQLCNVLVFNLNKRHKMDLHGVVYYKRYNWENAWFGVWVTEGGSFTNLDWFKEDKCGFAGAYSMSGLFKDRVVFDHRPCYRRPYDK